MLNRDRGRQVTGVVYLSHLRRMWYKALLLEEVSTHMFLYLYTEGLPFFCYTELLWMKIILDSNFLFIPQMLFVPDAWSSDVQTRGKQHRYSIEIFLSDSTCMGTTADDKRIWLSYLMYNVSNSVPSIFLSKQSCMQIGFPRPKGSAWGQTRHRHNHSESSYLRRPAMHGICFGAKI